MIATQGPVAGRAILDPRFDDEQDCLHTAIEKVRRLIRRVYKAVFMATGLGKRFLPATISIPDEILPLVGRSLIQYVIVEAHEVGGAS